MAASLALSAFFLAPVTLHAAAPGAPTITSVTPAELVYVTGGTYAVERFTSTGIDLGPVINGLNFQAGVAVDSTGNIYVANYANETVEKFSANGTNLALFARPDPQSSGLGGIAFDSGGNL